MRGSTGETKSGTCAEHDVAIRFVLCIQQFVVTAKSPNVALGRTRMVYQSRKRDLSRLDY